MSLTPQEIAQYRAKVEDALINGATLRMRIDDCDDMRDETISTIIEIEGTNATIYIDTYEVEIDVDDIEVSDDGVLTIIQEMGLGMRQETKIYLEEVTAVNLYD